MKRILFLLAVLVLPTQAAHPDPAPPGQAPHLLPVRVITTRTLVARLPPVAGDGTGAPAAERCYCTGYLVFVNQRSVGPKGEPLRMECTADFDPAVTYSLGPCDKSQDCNRRCVIALESLAKSSPQTQACLKKIGGAEKEESHVTGECKKATR